MQNLQCSFYKIATCEAFLINTKIFEFKKKKLENYASYKKIPPIKTFFSTINISLPNFKALGSIIKALYENYFDMIFHLKATIWKLFWHDFPP